MSANRSLAEGHLISSISRMSGVLAQPMLGRLLLRLQITNLRLETLQHLFQLLVFRSEPYYQKLFRSLIFHLEDREDIFVRGRCD